MKKICVLIMFVGVCLSLSISNLNMGKVGADSKCQVSFHFDGLQAIAFGDVKRVSDGILDVPHHTPNIEIKQIKQGKETTLHTIKASELKAKSINIDIPNNTLQPKRYYSVDMAKDSQDFRWCLDIENDLFQKQLYLKDQFFAKIHFNVGTFYAENITEGKYQFVAGSTLHKFNRQIGRPNGRIDLSKSQHLIISGLDKSIDLPYQDGVSYSVEITNLPTKDMMNIDHFSFYYDQVKTQVPKFMPTPVKKASFFPAPITCEAVVFGKSFIK